MTGHDDKHERIPRSHQESAGIAVQHMLAHLDIVVVHTAGATEEEGRMGCLELDCVCSILQIVEMVVVHIVSANILKGMVAEGMQRVLEEAVAVLWTGFEELVQHYRKDVIDMVVAAMKSAEWDMAPTASDTVGTGAWLQKQDMRDLGTERAKRMGCCSQRDRREK